MTASYCFDGQALVLALKAVDYFKASPPVCRDDTACGMAVPDAACGRCCCGKEV